MLVHLLSLYYSFTLGDVIETLVSKWRGEEEKRRSVRHLTRDMATNVRPAQNSFLPTSITTLSSVSPCDLWMVIASMAAEDGNKMYQRMTKTSSVV